MSQDVVLVFCTATGMQNGELCEQSFINKTTAQEINGTHWSAIQITTAAGVCGVVDLVRNKSLPQSGFVSQEQVGLEQFLRTEFGCLYQPGEITALRGAA